MEIATTLGAELDDRLLRLNALLRRVAGRELSRTSASVLATLREGPRRITELAAGEAVAQPTMTTLVGRLERDNLVRRAADPADARAVLVHLTETGRERLVRLRAQRAAALDERLDALGPADRDALQAALPALDKLIEGDTE